MRVEIYISHWKSTLYVKQVIYFLKKAKQNLLSTSYIIGTMFVTFKSES